MGFRCQRLNSLVMCAALVSNVLPVLAGEVTTDGTIGSTPSTTVTLGATIPGTYDIVESLGERAGTNLFHSFLTFDIDVGEIALFSQDGGMTTTNVISRVTGGAASTLAGTISNIPGANFWFVNTAGIIINPGAVFDVSGALSVGAVDYIQFDGGLQYHAIVANQMDAISSLVVDPMEFGFLPASTAGDLIISGVALDNSLTGSLSGNVLLAGDGVSISGANLFLADSTIITNSGELIISGPSLSFDNTLIETRASTSAGGDINIDATAGDLFISNGTFIRSLASPIPGETGATGDIVIAADGDIRVNVDQAGAPLNGNNVIVTTNASGDSSGTGSITLDATNVIFTDVSLTAIGDTGGDISVQASEDVNATNSLFSSQDTSDAPGGAGSVSITANNILLLDSTIENASINADPGLIQLQAGNAIDISGGRLTVDTQGPGNGTGISLAASSVSLDDTELTTAYRQNLAAASMDRGGDILIDADAITMDSTRLQVSTEWAGDAGDIIITGGDVALNNGTQILATATGIASSTLDPVPPDAGGANIGSIGRAGDISILGTNSITANLAGNPGLNATVIITSAANNVDSMGAGNVTLNSPSGNVSLFNTTVEATTLSDVSNVVPADGGFVSLQANTNLGLTESVVRATTTGGANAGDVDITSATGTVSVNDTLLASNSMGTGDAGSITVSGDRINIMDSELRADAAGQVDLVAGFVALVANSDISVTNSVLNATTSESSGAEANSTVEDARGSIFLLSNDGDIIVRDSSLSIDRKPQTPAQADSAPSCVPPGPCPSNPAPVPVIPATRGLLLLRTAGSIDATDSSFSSTTSGLGSAGNITLDGADLMVSGGSFAAQTTGDGSAGDVSLLATGNIILDGGVSVGASSGPSLTNANATNGTGDAGSIAIVAGSQLTLIDARVVSSSATQTNTAIQPNPQQVGSSGSITLTANAITLSDATVSTTTDSDNINNAVGSITASAATVFTVINSQIAASTTGDSNAGNVNISATDFAMTGGRIAVTSDGGSGAAGNIIFDNLDTFSLTSGGDIVAQATSGSSAGMIAISANDTVSIAGSATDTAEINSSAGSGAAGRIDIDATSIVMTNARVATETGGGDVSIEAATIRIGDGATSSLSLLDSAVSASTSGDSNAGSIALNAESILISGNASVTASTSADGNAGSIALQANNIELADQAEILASTSGPGRAGDVVLTASDTITLPENTLIAARSSAPGDAGSVTIQADGLVAVTGATIESSSIGAGAAGNVGLAGSITVSAGELVIADGLISTRTNSDAGEDLDGPGTISLFSEGGVLLDNSIIETATTGLTDAGDIEIESNTSIMLVNGTQVSASTSGLGDAGDITLATPGAITLSPGGEVRATSTGLGDAGTLSLLAGSSLTLDNALVTTSFAGDPNRVILDEDGTAGDIQLAGSDVTITSTLVSTQSNSVLDTNIEDDGVLPGTISINATGLVLIEQDSLISASVSGEGAGGAININAADLTLLDSGVSASTSGASNAGSITLRANGLVTVNGATIESSSIGAGAAGNVGLAGSIDISGGELIIADGLVSTRTNSDAGEDFDGPGTIRLFSEGGVLLDNSIIETATTGLTEAGDIDIEANSGIVLANSAQVSASTSGLGDAGDITLTTPGAITLSPGGEVSARSTGLGDAGTLSLLAGSSLTLDNALVTTSFAGDPNRVIIDEDGTAGDIQLAGSDITITGALVSTQSNSAVNTNIEEDGVRPGTISIDARGLVLIEQDSLVSASVSGEGAGGAINIDAVDLTLLDGSIIETRATGAGDSGSISLLVANDLTLSTPDQATNRNDQTAILTSSQASTGGTISANVEGVLFMDTSLIESSVATAGGQGGNIELTANGLFIVNSQILARAAEGNGGAITISRGSRTADPSTDTPFDGLFVIDSQTLINADSQQGVSGEVSIDSPDADLAGIVEAVDARIVEDPTLADDICNPASRAAQSSFIVEDRGGVAPAPDGYFSAGVLTDGSHSSQATGGQVADNTTLVSVVAGGCE